MPVLCPACQRRLAERDDRGNVVVEFRARRGGGQRMQVRNPEAIECPKCGAWWTAQQAA